MVMLRFPSSSLAWEGRPTKSQPSQFFYLLKIKIMYFHNLPEHKQNDLIHTLVVYILLSLNSDGSISDDFDQNMIKFWSEQGKGIEIPESWLSYETGPYDNCWKGDGTVNIYELKRRLTEESIEFEGEHMPETYAERQEANHDNYSNRY